MTIQSKPKTKNPALKKATTVTKKVVSKPKKVVPTKIALIVSECSEALEGHRKGLKDDKLPHREMVAVELADVLIRVFDLAGFLGIPLGTILEEKAAYNQSRLDHKPENRVKVGGKKY